MYKVLRSILFLSEIPEYISTNFSGKILRNFVAEWKVSSEDMFHITLLPVCLNQIWALLCNHDDRSVDVAASYFRQDGSVYNTESLNSMNSQVTVDYCFTWSWSHDACATLVVLGVGVVSNGTLPVFVSAKREVFAPLNWCSVQFQMVALQGFCLG
jgi:hypothetical protein